MVYFLPALLTLIVLVAIEAAWPAENWLADEAIEGWEEAKAAADFQATTGAQD